LLFSNFFFREAMDNSPLVNLQTPVFLHTNAVLVLAYRYFREASGWKNAVPVPKTRRKKTSKRITIRSKQTEGEEESKEFKEDKSSEAKKIGLTTLELYRSLEPQVQHISPTMNYHVIAIHKDSPFVSSNQHQSALEELGMSQHDALKRLRSLYVITQGIMRQQAEDRKQAEMRKLESEMLTQGIHVMDMSSPARHEEPIICANLPRHQLLGIHYLVDIMSYPYFYVRLRGQNTIYETLYFQSDVIQALEKGWWEMPKEIDLAKVNEKAVMSIPEVLKKAIRKTIVTF
jgi:hypothetical protein